MKVLLIGNREHQLLFNLINEINSDRNDILFDIYSQDSNCITLENKKYYNEVFNLNLKQIFTKNRLVRGISKQIVFRKKIKSLFKNDYNYVHIHYVEDIILRDVDFFIKYLNTKLIISVWGSDFLRADDQKREQMRKLFKLCDTITISNALVIEAFRMYYKDEEFCSKIAMNKFFVKPLNDLLTTYNAKQHNIAKLKLNIAEDKKVITIGYNASKMQQHLSIIEALYNDNKFVEKYKHKLHFILPLTYPKNAEYINEIEEKLKKIGFSYSLFTEFLSNSDLLELRYSSDIFIQLQTTDMMSGSMLEYLALGNLVITGSWLPYQELLDEGIKFNTIDTISDLAPELVNIDLSNLGNMNNNIKNVAAVFERNKLISNWIRIYD